MKIRKLLLSIYLLTLVTACGGSSGSNFSISGTITGLNGQIQLSVNNATYSTSSNGSFTFPFSFRDNTSYSITITQQPIGQLCKLRNASGFIAGANITDFSINCNNSLAISGTISSTTLTVVDSDINDPLAVANISNNLFSTAQAINNLTTLHGFASKVGTGFTGDRFASTFDENDVYQVDLQQGQTIHMQVVDFAGIDFFQGDLDLYLYNNTQEEVDSSLSTTEFEQLTVPADGSYYIRVSAFSGISKYTLKIDSVNTSSLATNQPMNFVANESIIKFKNASQAASFTLSNNHISLIHNDTSRATLAKIPSTGIANKLFGGKQKQPEFLTQLKELNPVSYAKTMTLLEIKRLKMRPDIAYAEPNYIYKPLRVPNDTFYNQQWHYPNINLPQAWDITTGTPASGNVIVAVIDTGVFLSHADLSGQLVSGYDFISSISNANDGNGIDANPDDPGDGTQIGNSSWHGTHVAGTVAANTDNNAGVAGVSWGAKIMPLRVLGTQGGTSFDIIQAILYSARLSNQSNTLPPQKADIINMSLGGPGFSQATQDAITQARAANVIVIAAAGNDNSSQLFYPASYDGVVSVSAIDFLNNRAPYSNFGSRVDVAAPGGNQNLDSNNDGNGDGVLSTLVNDANGTRVSAYRYYQGTSMASPHIAGVAALMRAVHPGLSVSDFDNLLAAGSITNEAGSSGRDDIYGHGIIDALKAVQAAQSLIAGPPPAPPALIIASPSNLVLGNASSAQLTLSNLNATPASITGFTDNASWLSVAENMVDATTKLGTYTVTINRTGLSDSIYNATITFNLSTGNTLNVQLSMTVGSISTLGEIGSVYLLLIDTADNSIVGQTTPISQGNGIYSYTFTSIASGSYQVVGGSDIDNDLTICQLAEMCGGFPVINALTSISLSDTDLNDIDFNMDILSTIGAVNKPYSIQGIKFENTDTKSDSTGISR